MAGIGRICALAMSACACAPPVELAPGSEGSGGEDSAASTGTSPHDLGTADVPAERRCGPVAGALRGPQSIEEAVHWINELPRPVSVACFIESLPRPLAIHATQSTFSAQPSSGPESPRVFIFSGELRMSIATGGIGRHLLEFGEVYDADRSLKGELELPIEDAVTLAKPFSTVLYGEGSDCGLCHYPEVAVQAVDGTPAFASIAYRPAPSHHLEIDDVRDASRTCDPRVAGDRCETLAAVFAHGHVFEQAFPEHLPIFVD